MRLVAALFLLVPLSTYGEPAYQTIADGARVVLHTDKCELKEITNLPFKATWHEGSKNYEGCYGLRPDAGIVVFYFNDKTVGIAPMQAFTKVTGV